VDAPLALYRRYRPDSFAQVIGQDHVTEPLRAALRHNRVNHAYLFSGPRGCGKTSSARILARALNCAAGPIDEPCGECDSCRELATGGPGSVDVIEIDAASHGGVDDARELREQATFQPMRDRFKIYIIDEAHMVTPQGFNALLKIVEEPPEHVRFIFATTEPEKVIGTVRSRTHHYPFRLIPPKVLSAYLGDLCQREGVSIEPAAIPLVVRAGGGSARDTLSILDQLIGGAGEGGVTYALTAALLGFTPDTLLDEVVDAFAAHDGAGVFGVVDKVIEVGQDPRRFTEDLLQRLRDLLIIAAVPDASATGLIDVPEDQAERLVAQAARFGHHELSRAADLVAEGLSELKGTSAPRLLLELLCARVLLPGADDGSRGLATRIDRIEKRMEMAPPTDQPAVRTARQRTPEPVPEPVREPVEVQAPTPAGQPAPQPVEQPAPQPVEQPAVETPAPVGGLTLVDVRRLWPEVVEAVKAKRRVTWIQLSQHAQIVGLEGRTLTLGFNNPGARESFLNGRSDVILQQVLIDLVGQDWKVDAIIDPSAQPGTEPAVHVTRPAVAPTAAPSHPSPPSSATQAQLSPSAKPSEPPAWARPDAPAETPAAPPQARQVNEGADRNDRDAEEQLDGAELLSQRLGAQVIEEIPHN
jgi:DNA polymerase-3 subunit gamma/tau